MIWDMLGKGVVQGKPEKVLYDTCTYGAITSWEFENWHSLLVYKLKFMFIFACQYTLSDWIMLHVFKICDQLLKFYLKFAIIVFIYLWIYLFVCFYIMDHEVNLETWTIHPVNQIL